MIEWTAESILEMARNFQSACVLIAGAELDVFRVLAAGDADARHVAAELATDGRATAMLLDALVALRLVEKNGDRYGVSPSVKQLLAGPGAAGVLDMVLHQANCLRRWAQLARVVQTGRCAEREPSVRGAEADEASFIGAMNVVTAPIAPQLVGELGPPPFEHLLDVGGASGTWTRAFLHARPAAQATIFDLPHVIPMARRRMADAGLSDRVDFAAGDFLADPLPRGADLAWVSAIVHQNSRAENRRMFAAIFEALAVGGRILIRDIIMDNDRSSPPAGALFAINMLVATEAGGTYTFDELKEDLESAGFTRVELLRRDEAMSSIIQASTE